MLYCCICYALTLINLYLSQKITYLCQTRLMYYLYYFHSFSSICYFFGLVLVIYNLQQADYHKKNNLINIIKINDMFNNHNLLNT